MEKDVFKNDLEVKRVDGKHFNIFIDVIYSKLKIITCLGKSFLTVFYYFNVLSRRYTSQLLSFLQA